MPAFTATIGMPEPRMPQLQQQRAADLSKLSFRYVLQIATTSGWKSIAIANTADELKNFLKVWCSVGSNAAQFTGQTRIELVPEISSAS